MAPPFGALFLCLYPHVRTVDKTGLPVKVAQFQSALCTASVIHVNRPQFSFCFHRSRQPIPVSVLLPSFPATDPSFRSASIVPGDMRAGNAFHPPVRTLVDEMIPSVSAPPGNSREFQARAGLFKRVERPEGDFNARVSAPPGNSREFQARAGLPNALKRCVSRFSTPT